MPASKVVVTPLVSDSARRERGRQLVVVAGVLTVDRHDPGEDRLARGEVIGDRTLDQPITGEVLVTVDVAGDHQIGDRSDDLVVWVRLPDHIELTDRFDELTVDGNRSVTDHVPVPIHRHDGAPHDSSLIRGSAADSQRQSGAGMLPIRVRADAVHQISDASADVGLAFTSKPGRLADHQPLLFVRAESHRTNIAGSMDA